MEKTKYDLNADERIVNTVSNVQYGNKGDFTNKLLITNQSVILEKYGLFNKFKGIERFSLNEIKQLLVNDEKMQLEIYLENETIYLKIQSYDKYILKLLAITIEDQLSENADIYDYNFYQKILKNVRVEDDLIELRAKKEKGYSKEILGTIKEELFDELGIYDFQDEITDWLNDFREEHGLGHKMTHEEIAKLRRKENEVRENAIENQKKIAFEKKVEKQRKILLISKNKTDSKLDKLNEPQNKMTTDEQIKILKKLKELLDAGILTDEEFIKKKREIMKI